ncbi:MAG TPA: hypothetical protein VGW57_01515 [Chthoniobacterales bacterium]|nr:hypothetical protein [Chthoniobacterales bacterium]
MFALIGTLFIGLSTGFAQQQERRLAERLLNPDTSLSNPAQNRKFPDKQAAPFDKPARTANFFPAQKSIAKSFPEERAFTAQQFAARHFRAADSAAYISSRSRSPKYDALIATPTATAGTLVAPQSSQTAPVRDYAGSRPFLEQGKSQQSLRALDKPLTIEQVRELLNKSK